MYYFSLILRPFGFCLTAGTNWVRALRPTSHFLFLNSLISLDKPIVVILVFTVDLGNFWVLIWTIRWKETVLYFLLIIHERFLGSYRLITHEAFIRCSTLQIFTFALCITSIKHVHTCHEILKYTFSLARFPLWLSNLSNLNFLTCLSHSDSSGFGRDKNCKTRKSQKYN